MAESSVTQHNLCFHCGDECLSDDQYLTDEHQFCCPGCQSVYTILSANSLCNYYAYNDHPGANRLATNVRFDYLDEPAVCKELIDYRDDKNTVITFFIPHIHCSSCLWLLEQLHTLNPSISYCRVDFLKKQLSLKFNHTQLSLKSVVCLLNDLGYEPLISLQDIVKEKKPNIQDNLIQKIAVAGFCFGNVMLLSFPAYFGLSAYEHTLSHFFSLLNFFFCLPVVLFSAWGYYISAWQNIRNRVLNIDFPLALGITVLFFRTAADIFIKGSPGFADTLCGLVFFLLIGKFVQIKAYHHISFERDYRSFFPVAVQIIEYHKEKSIPLSRLLTGQRLIVRNNEIIPADAILLKGNALIDFSFVTGESVLQPKTLGEIIYAGGRQTGAAIELEVIKAVSQSYLTQLWNNEAFKRPEGKQMQTFNDRVSKYFTVILLVIATSAFLFWAFTDFARGIAAFTAVLIIACPCALALSTPFTMAAALSIFDRNFFYLKNIKVIEQLAKIDTLVLDKTGTITSGTNRLSCSIDLSAQEKQLLLSTGMNSLHPLSKMVCNYLGSMTVLPVTAYQEEAGRGIKAKVAQLIILIGSHEFVLSTQTCPNRPLFKGAESGNSTRVYFSIENYSSGYFSINHAYRQGLEQILGLRKRLPVYLLSGDQDYERNQLEQYFDTDSMQFNQSPQNKLEFIADLQDQHARVMMIGDGLNDAGALMQSDLGIAITDNINTFSPGCDAILEGKSLVKLPLFMLFANDTIKVIHISFACSLIYNLIGLSFAITGRLSPLTAAILMPLSTLTIISFTTIATHLFAKKRNLL